MSYIQGEGRSQGTLFPVVLDDLVPADHVCRVIDAFVDGLAMAALGFERAKASETGRPGYDPLDLLKLYLYGNVELMWLLGRLYPAHKSIAEFRRMHTEAAIQAGAELVRFAKSCGRVDRHRRKQVPCCRQHVECARAAGAGEVSGRLREGG
jgi:transposase